METKVVSEIIEKFIISAREAASTIEVIPCDADALNTALLAAAGDEQIILSEPDYLSAVLFSKFKLNKNVITVPTKEQLSNTKTGITDAFCGIASTGSVCVAIRNNLTSPVSMLSRRHIVVLDSRTIVPKPRDIFSTEFSDMKELTKNFTIITGPSATADMGPLVRGVHGPGKLHIIVLN